jgi:SAM-dependent methyltransferase
MFPALAPSMAEFDREASIYDETRAPPAPEELRAVLHALEGCPRVLEGGVGTGRFSVPLSEQGHQMTGVDISREMMRRARQKGLGALVLGSLYRLPFREASFDASLLVHVLQLLPDPFSPLRELARVSRQRVVAVFPDRGGREGMGRFRERYRQYAEELGYPLPPRPRYWENGQKLLAAVPPAGLERVELPRDPGSLQSRLERRQAFGFSGVPPEVHAKILDRLQQERGGERTDRPPRRTVHVAWWEARTLLGPLPTA